MSTVNVTIRTPKPGLLSADAAECIGDKQVPSHEASRCGGSLTACDVRDWESSCRARRAAVRPRARPDSKKRGPRGKNHVHERTHDRTHISVPDFVSDLDTLHTIGLGMGSASGDAQAHKHRSTSTQSTHRARNLLETHGNTRGGWHRHVLVMREKCLTYAP